ncbi:uncharacterized protein LOC130775367 [Actinidia eriantha]|uniref:uncharacterized protein LOC130775367 n=1 Tax=Actinidia eriantha TaxID=165200 RepID=UPI00258B7F22|nr:uncharacterized protein LOC130775367 [Actinidia eriantha]
MNLPPTPISLKMHLQIFPTFCVLIINFIHFRILLGADNERYTDCSRSYPCANIPDIPYPFWGGDKPEYCGNPSFELNCQGEAPNITIQSWPYRVLSINNATFTLNVAQEEFWNNNCPAELHNATLDATHFQYAPNTEDLMLYYGCSLIPIPNQFNCSENQITTFGIYVTANLASQITPSGNCSNGVRVRVNQTAAAALAGNASGNITQVLNSGFGLVWEANNNDCQSCVGSGGRCGTDYTRPGSLVCYCSDGPYLISCNSTKISSGSNDSEPMLKFLIVYSVGGILLSTMIVGYFTRRRTTLFNKEVALMKKVRADVQNVEGFLSHYESLAPKQYKYSDLHNMTNSFKDKLGQGAYGVVYKGKLSDGRLVAVKILSETKGNGEEFINEVASISRTSHVNVVALLGFCFERNRRALVYEFMAKGSLDKFIYDDDCQLELKTLYQIAIDTARGLEYLHRGCSTRIVHFDIKPQNILLDEDFSPKISDFGLAQLCQRKESIISMMGARGTAGYIAPEVFSRAFGRVSHKSDVYSYGMLVLEMIGAREKVGGVSQTSEIYFPDWIYEHLERGRDLTLRGVNTTEEEETTRKMILVGLWCIQTNPLDRPRMSRVVEMLEGSLESLQIPPKPILFSPARPDSLGQEYSSESLSTVTNGVDMSEERLRSLQIPSEPVQFSPSGTGYPAQAFSLCEAPNITIQSRPYRVLSINNAIFTLNVAREEFWNNNCPAELHNATLDATHFQYAPNTEELMLYYGCRVIATGSPIPYRFNCSENQIPDTFGIYVTANRASNSTLNTLNVNCSNGVSVRVNQTAAAALADNTSGNITQVLNSGFGLVWEANNDDCQSCVGSGGRCGTNSTSPGSFVCYSIRSGSGSNGLNLKLKLVLERTEQNVEGFLSHYESLAPKQYKYSDLHNMTNSFKDKLGQGAYGAVYKGKLSDGRPVAVKILSETKGNGEEFINEVASISRTSHVNVVALLGFCFERNRRALVYEFMAKGSLDKFIYDDDCHLELRTLYQIAIDTARGLEYLHRGCSTRIVHFDIKPQNILLDEDFSPKISDFGLAKLCQRKESIISMMGARGTAGYIAPEVFSRAFGRVSHKSDVYSYGMLVLEMIGAREKVGGVSQTSEIYFPDWIYEHLERGRDLTLRGANTTEEKEIMRKMILVGLWCIQTNPLDRPRMSRVVEMLEGSLESLQIPPKPILYSPARPDSLGQEYSSESLSTVTNEVDMSEGSLLSLQIPSEPVQFSPSGTG